jgi:class III poly(R)-hydroxyalkanoic acid synthase PhaE subunit
MGELFKKSFEIQQNMAKAWLNAVNPPAAGGSGEKTAAEDPLAAMTKMYQGIYETWQKQFLDNPWMKMTPWSYNLFNSANPVQDMFNKMMNSGKGLADLSAIWQQLAGKDPFKSRDDILKFIEDNKADFERLSMDFINPFIPDSMRPLVSNAMDLVKQYESAGKGFIKPWLELGPKSAEDFRKIAEGDHSAYGGLYKTLNQAYQDSFGKMLSAAGLGLTREQNETVMSQFDAFFKMILSLTELMSLVADVARENMVTVIETYGKLIAEGKQPRTLKEFYDIWVKVNEDSFVKVFGTPQFSKIFCDFAQKSCEFKIYVDKVLEQTLNWVPFPKNSDMVSLYKTVYDLRKSDYKSNKELDEIREELASLKAAVTQLNSSKKGDK